MSVSLYYEAKRAKPLSAAEQNAIAALVAEYDAAMKQRWGSAVQCESFCVYPRPDTASDVIDPNDPVLKYDIQLRESLRIMGDWLTQSPTPAVAKVATNTPALTSTATASPSSSLPNLPADATR